jgi:hypothetical protein
VPGRAAELPVRGALKTEVLLQRHGVTNRSILLLSEVLGFDSPLNKGLSGLKKFGRSKQTPDVVGSKRWR